jgi:tetratricopeptide (TPR) repeat protein
MLRSTKPLPAAKMVRCPQCGSEFMTSAPAAVNGSPPPFDFPRHRPLTAPSSGRPMVLAVAGAIVVAGFIVAGAVFWALNRQPPAVAQDEDKGRKEDDAQKRLDAERKKLEEERAKLEQDKRRVQFNALMKQAGYALAANRPEEAEKAYTEALKLIPEDAEAAKGLATVRTLLKTDARTKEDDDKRKGEFARLMEKGKEAMADKRFAEAVQAFSGANQLVTGDAAAVKALDEAEKALAADATEKKKLEEYKTHMDAAQAAMAGQRFGDAVREYVAAQRVLPNDPAAVRGQTAAEKQLDNLQDLDKRRTEYARLMDNGNNALRARRFDEAIKAFDAAMRLFPNERDAQQGAKDARRLKEEAKVEFSRYMTLGDVALSAQRIEEAIRNYTEATRLLPGDELAERSLRNAQRLLNDLAAAQVAYGRFMDQGFQAMRNQNYLDAVRNFTEALRLVPNDLDATRGLADAQAALDKVARRQQDYDKQIQIGSRALTARKWADAVKAFSAALDLIPNDQRATDGLSKARFGQAMADGQAAMTAKRYADAVASFEKALAEMPGDPQATAALRQAKALNRGGTGNTGGR